MILYEFLYGVPPFHAETPEKVFENILNRAIYFDEDVDISEEARDFIERLICLDVSSRLGTKTGSAEVKEHRFFHDINWDTLPTDSPNFKPQVDKLDDTSYFDTRGVSNKLSDLVAEEEGDGAETDLDSDSVSVDLSKLKLGPSGGESNADFGTFVYKNLLALERANNAMVQKLRSDGITGGGGSSRDSIRSDSSDNVSGSSSKIRHRSLPPGLRRSRPDSLQRSPSGNPIGGGSPNASSLLVPAHSSGTISSGSGSSSKVSLLESKSLDVPGRGKLVRSNTYSDTSTSPSVEPSPYSVPHTLLHHEPEQHSMIAMASSLPHTPPSGSVLSNRRDSNSIISQRRDSYQSTTISVMSMSDNDDRFFSNTGASSGVVGSGATSSSNGGGGGLLFEDDSKPIEQPLTVSQLVITEPSKGSREITSPMLRKHGITHVLIAGDDLETAGTLEQILTTEYGCYCIVVKSGEDALRCAMGDISFGWIFLESDMSVVDGATVRRMIKTASSCNRDAYVVGLFTMAGEKEGVVVSSTTMTTTTTTTTTPPTDDSLELFDATLMKPVTLEKMEELVREWALDN